MKNAYTLLPTHVYHYVILCCLLQEVIPDMDPAVCIAIMQRSNLVHLNFQLSSLKEKQQKCLTAAADHDVLAILPTGYGKTVIIQCLPFLGEQQQIVVIVSPLNTIITEQSGRFGDRGRVVDEDFIKSLKEDADKMESDIIENDVLYLIGHPENITSKEMKKFMMRDSLAGKVINV